MSVSDEVARITARVDPVRLEQALDQYARRQLGMAKAAALAGLHLMDFQYVAGARGIELAITTDDLAEDVETLQRLERRSFLR